MRLLQKHIRKEQSGAAVVEFGLIAPILAVTLMGLFDVAYNLYTSTILRGIIHEAARGSTIESADTGRLDALVRERVGDVMPQVTITFDRRAYAGFEEVGQTEDFTDVNNDGTCNDGEPYEDSNENGTFDADRGTIGQGAARDAVLYTATMSYDRMFPMSGLIGLSEQWEVSTSTVLRNQPYDNTPKGAPTIRNCI